MANESTRSSSALEDVITAALDSIERLVDQSTVNVRFGPVPITVTSRDSEQIRHVELHATGDETSAPWRHMHVALLDGESCPDFDVDARLRPTGDPTTGMVAQSNHLLAVRDASTLWVADTRRSLIARWVASPEDIPIWETIRPLRFALRWWAVAHGGALVHTAAVAGRRGAALIVGPAGAGKSTTAFACLGRGPLVLGDDYCLVEPASPAKQAVVHASYILGTLDDHSLGMLPHLEHRIIGTGLRGKSLVALDRLPHGTGSSPAIAVCALDRRPGERTRLEPISRAEVLRLLAPSTMFQIPGLQRETWSALLDVVRGLPAFRLVVGNLDAARDVLAELVGADVQPEESEMSTS